MKRCAALPMFIALLTAPTMAQNELKWGTNVEEAIKVAQKNQRPIMFYIVSRGEDRNEKTERQHRAAFKNARVVAQGQRFVATQLSRSRYKELLEKWQVSAITNQEIVFATPAGDLMDKASDSDIASPDLFARKMADVFKRYRAELFSREVKPTLEKENAPPKEILEALKTIEEFMIPEADALLIQVAESEKQAPNVRLRAYEVLAQLSTDAAADALMKAAPQDKRIIAALQKLTPGAAERLLSSVGGESMETHLLAYSAVAKITRLPEPKPEAFWNGPNQQIKLNEIERVKAHVEKIAKRWKEEDAPYR